MHFGLKRGGRCGLPFVVLAGWATMEMNVFPFALLAVPDPSFFHGSGDRFTVRNFLGQTDVGDHSYVPHDSDVRRHNR